MLEKLIYKGIVKKHNRKLIAAMSLFIAFKGTVYGGYTLNKDRFQMLEQDVKKLLGDSAHPTKSSSAGGYKFLHKPMIHYELRILSALNF